MPWCASDINKKKKKKCGKLRAMDTKLGQKNPWYTFMMMMTFMEVKGHQRSNVINYVLWLPNLVRIIPDASLWWWPANRSEVIRGQMWYYVLWLPNLVRRIPDTSLWWWWPSWRSKVIWVKYSKLCSMATKLGQTISYDNDDLHRGQKVNRGQMC